MVVINHNLKYKLYEEIGYQNGRTSFTFSPFQHLSFPRIPNFFPVGPAAARLKTAWHDTAQQMVSADGIFQRISNSIILCVPGIPPGEEYKIYESWVAVSSSVLSQVQVTHLCL